MSDLSVCVTQQYLISVDMEKRMEKGTLIKDFRKKVLELKNQVDDKQFFLSEEFLVYLQNLAEAICKAYTNTIRICIHWKDDGPIAWANNRSELALNINNEYFHKVEGRVNKTVIQKSFVLHECGHLLFTDFHLLESQQKVFFDNRKLFPEPKCEEYKEWLADVNSFDQSSLLDWYKVWKRLENSLEDGFIEYMILSLVPGEGQCLYVLRKMQYDNFESVKVMKSKGLTNPQIFFNALLSFSKYGTIKMDADDKKEPAIEALLSCFDLIKTTTHTQKSYDRVLKINEIFCKLYKFMKEDKEKQQEEEKNNPDQKDSENSKEEQNKEQNEEEQNSNGQSEKNDETGNQNQSDNSNGSDDSNSQQNSSSQNANPDNSSQDGTEKNNSSSQENNNSSTSPSDLLNNSPEELNDNINTGSGSVLNDKNIKQEPQTQSRNNQEKLEALQKELEPEATIPTPEDKRMCDTIEEKIAADEVKKQAEQELANQLSEEVENFDFTNINRGVGIKITRKDPSKQAVELYENDMQEINFLVKKTVDEIRNKIKDHQQGGKINGLYQGRYLDRNSLYRYDMRMLCKNDLPEDIPNMAFSILIDASGSMSNIGKLDSARRTALLLYHFGKALGIPVMVYAHNVRGTVEMSALADYGSVDGNDKYRICDLTAGGCNRDGMALRFCSEKLSSRPEETKICFVISDGRPSDYSSGTEANNDIRGVLMDYSKKNVKYIAFGLGSDQRGIEDIYTQNLSPKVAAKFIKTDEPTDLPKSVVQCIKELIKV